MMEYWDICVTTLASRFDYGAEGLAKKSLLMPLKKY
jgi:hypothetical protein